VNDDDIRILAAFNAAADYWTNGIWFTGSLGAFIAVVAAARGIWFLVPVGVGFFGLLAYGLWRLRRKYTSPTGSPVLDAMLNHPERVASITHFTAQSSNGMFRKEFLRVKLLSGQHLSLKVDEEALLQLTDTLARRCPKATVTVPGYAR
jgi:hypothetical protein